MAMFDCHIRGGSFRDATGQNQDPRFIADLDGHTTLTLE